MRLSANALDQDFDGRANPPFLFNSFIVYEDVRANAPQKFEMMSLSTKMSGLRPFDPQTK